MMEEKAGFRPLQRLNRGLLLKLRMEDWPADVPLQENIALGQSDQVPLLPAVDYFLEPAYTAERIVGIFHLQPAILEDAAAWYQDRLAEKGWTPLTEENYVHEDSAYLRFDRPEVNAKLQISIRKQLVLDKLVVSISRSVVVPWPEKEEEDSEGVEETLSDEVAE
jgi:hypothetical protein